MVYTVPIGLINDIVRKNKIVEMEFIHNLE